MSCLCHPGRDMLDCLSEVSTFSFQGWVATFECSFASMKKNICLRCQNQLRASPGSHETRAATFGPPNFQETVDQKDYFTYRIQLVTLAQISIYCLLTVHPETSLGELRSTSQISDAFSRGHDPIAHARRATSLAHVGSIFNECVTVIVSRSEPQFVCSVARLREFSVQSMHEGTR